MPLSPEPRENQQRYSDVQLLTMATPYETTDFPTVSALSEYDIE